MRSTDFYPVEPQGPGEVTQMVLSGLSAVFILVVVLIVASGRF